MLPGDEHAATTARSAPPAGTAAGPARPCPAPLPCPGRRAASTRDTGGAPRRAATAPRPDGDGQRPHVFAIVLGIVALLLAAYHIAILIHHLAVIRLGAAPIPALMPVLEFVPAPPINVHLAVVISCAPLLASEPSCSSGTVRRSWPHRSPPASTSSYWSATSSSPRFR